MTSFLGLIALVILAAGLTLLVALNLGVPVSVIAILAMLGSLALGMKQWR
ncbi:hypothetical protein [Pseudogemmobacter bohemicus]|nr:hypothetical protein [Pseudogemmobacter bohemicus]